MVLPDMRLLTHKHVIYKPDVLATTSDSRRWCYDQVVQIREERGYCRATDKEEPYKLMDVVVNSFIHPGVNC